MYLSNDIGRINAFRAYCDNNYSAQESDIYFKMFLSTLLELDIETDLIKKLDVNKVYKAKGDYSSNIIFLMHKYDENIIKFLDLFVNGVFKVNIEHFCIWFYEKTDIPIASKGKQLMAIYNEMLNKEMKVFNYDLVINLSKLHFQHDKAISFSYDNTKELSVLALKKDLTNEELSRRNILTNDLFSIIKNTNVKKRS